MRSSIVKNIARKRVLFHGTTHQYAKKHKEKKSRRRNVQVQGHTVYLVQT